MGTLILMKCGITQIETMKKGEIRVYTYNNEKLTVAVEYCAEAESVKDIEYYYAFDNPALDMIKSGDWEVDSYPHWSGDSKKFSLCDSTFMFKVLLNYNGKQAVGEIHRHLSREIIYWHPLGKSQYKWTDKDCVYTDQPNSNLYWANSFRNPITRKQKEVSKLMLLRQCVLFN